MVTYTKNSPKMVNQRDIAGTAEEEDPCFSLMNHTSDFNTGALGLPCQASGIAQSVLGLVGPVKYTVTG